nr:hypothetical protein [Paraburkholderia sp. BL8N3]
MEAALICFSTYDLHRTTVFQIAIYTGVPAARLTVEFGDETQIFGAVLTWYLDEGFVAWLHRLQSICDPVEAILRFFESITEQPGSTETNEVRLLFVTAMNLAPGSPIFGRIVAVAMHKLETFFCECVTEGLTSGQIIANETAEDIAKLLLVFVAALPVLACMGDRGSILQILHSVQSLLEQDIG